MTSRETIDSVEIDGTLAELIAEFSDSAAGDVGSETIWTAVAGESPELPDGFDRVEDVIESTVVSISEFQHPDDPEETVSWSWQFGDLDGGRVGYGLWKSCGPFPYFDLARAVPVEVAREGQVAIVAYLYLFKRSRGDIAVEVNLDEDTVSNYLSQIRWPS